MEPLLDLFREINIEAEEEAQHPVLGPGEYIESNVTLPIGDRTPEEQCNIRWPGAEHEELAVMQQRQKRHVQWDELQSKLDALAERWQTPMREQKAMGVGISFALPSPKGRRFAREVDRTRVFSMGVGALFATVLMAKNSQHYGESGEIWRFPISEMEQGRWRAIPRTAPVEHYQTSYSVRTLLYVLDGPFLRVIDINKGDLFKAHFYQAAGLSDDIRFRSLRVNRAGVLLAQSTTSNLVVLAYVASFSGEFQLTILDRLGCADDGVGYSAVFLSPSGTNAHQFVLGRSDGIVERYSLELSPEKVQFDQQGKFDLFQPKKSTATGKELKIAAGQPIQGLYLRGFRLSAYTDKNWVIITQVEGVPQVYRKVRPDNPIVDQCVHGDMTASLLANGELTVQTYWSSTFHQIIDQEDMMMRKENYIPGGQQRVTMLSDAAVALYQHGDLLILKLK